MMHEIPQTPLAIVGMACRLPGADGLDAFWRLLIEGRSAIDVLPPDRLDPELHYDPRAGMLAKSYSRIGGLLDSRPVDLSGCPLAPDLVGRLDPCHMILWEVAAQACRDAGFDPGRVPHRRAGVFIGHSRGSMLAGELIHGTLIEQTAQYLREIDEFRSLCGDETDSVIREVVEHARRNSPRRDSTGGPWLDAHLGAALLARAFGLDGPSAVVNAACASGLTALTMGAWQLRLGSIDMAMVGAASHVIFNTLVLFSQARSVSATGSRPFDATADGLVAGEGYVVLLVKTLARALADGNRIHAVVRGIGMSSDGRGKSLWAPRKEGQIEAVRRAYGAGLDVSRLQYIEAHATSTQVGDATEVAALAAALVHAFPAERKIPIGSVKSNVGHTLETAGLAGLVKTILAMRHGMIPPTINLETLNPQIDWNSIPFFVPTGPHPWPAPADGHARRAAVNAFGIGGLNVHVVLDQVPTAAERASGRVDAPDERGRPSRSVGMLPDPHDAAADTAPASGKAAPPQEAIAVIGMGAVLPGARTIEAFWELIASGRDARSVVPPDRWDAALGVHPGQARAWRSLSGLGGFVTGFQYEWQRHKIPPRQVATADPLQFMVLDAVDQALAHAGYPARPLDKMRTAVVMGVPFQGEFFVHLQMGLRLPEFQRTLAAVLGARGVREDQIRPLAARLGDVLLKHMPALTDETGSFSSSSLASRITKTFDLMGGAVILDAGSASGLAALHVAVDMLRAGQCDTVICAAGDRALSLAHYERLSLSGMLTVDPAHAPLDEKANGLVPGEGAVVVLLKRLADARRDGDRVEAVIRGIGAARASSLDAAVTGAVRRSMHQAGVKASEITAAEIAATGVAACDRQELRGLAASYGSDGRPQPLVVGTLAGQIGHVSGAAGLASLVKTSLAMEHEQMPACAGLQTPAPYVAEQKALFQVPQRVAPLAAAHPEGRLLAGVSCHDLSDTAYHVIVERPVPVARPRLCPGSGETKEVEPRPGIAAARPARPRVAFVCAGQGSQYAGMLKGLVEAFPPAAEARRQIDDALARRQYPSFADLAWDNSEQLGKSVWRTQLAMLAADTIMHAAVSALGIRPDRIAGHSYGQFPALVAAGAWDFETAAQATFARCRAIESSARTDGGMLCVFAEMDLVERLCRQAGGRVYVANHNAPLQTIVGGDHESVARLLARLQQEGVHTRVLPVPRPFHTPLMEEVKEPFRTALIDLPMEPPEVPFLSGVCNRYLADPEDLRADLVSQLTSPVRYVELIQRLADEGVTVFVEIGPEQILTRLNRQILGGREVLLVGSDHRKRGGVAALRALCSALEGAGVSVPQAGVLDRAPPPAAAGPRAQAASAAPPAEAVPPAAPILPASHLESPAPGVPAGAGCDVAASRVVVRSPDAAVPASPEERVPGVLHLSGTPHAMGLQHGRARAEAIRTILRRCADLANGVSGPLPPVDVGPSQLEHLLDPEDLEEITGIAEGACVGLQAVIAHNLRMFPDVASGCSHFAVAAAENGAEGLIHGANEDLPIGLTLRDCLARTVQVRHPEGRLPHVLFAVAGAAGGLSGVNAAGLAATSAMLLDLPRRAQGPLGRLHGVLLKRILEQASNVESALEIARRTPRIAAGWGLLLSHAPSDEICYVEYDGEALQAKRGLGRVVAGNRALHSRPRAAAPDHCQRRLDRLAALVGEAAGPVSVERAQKALRDRFDTLRARQTPHPTMNTVRRVDNQISLVWQAAMGQVSATAGPSARSQEDRFYQLRLDRLLPSLEALAATTAKRRAEKTTRPAVQTTSAGARAAPAPRRAAPAGVAQIAAPAARPSHAPAPQSAPGGSGGVADADTRMCARFVMRLREAPLAEAAPRPLQLHGAAVILGDNPVVLALRDRLLAQGARVNVLSAGASQDEVVSALERAWHESPAPHLFLLGPYDRDATTTLGEPGWSDRLARGVMLPYGLCQRWFQLCGEAGLVDLATVVACAALGGEFGFSGQVTSAESGALAGLMKALAIEITRQRKSTFRSKVIDVAPGESAPKIADLVCRELASEDRDVEVAYQAGRRYVVRPVLEPAAAQAGAEVPRGGVWVVTGGARGVTAIVARELGRRFGLRLHLIGSSPAPQIDPAWLALSPEELRQVRAQVTQDALARGQVPIEAWKRVEKALEIARNLRALSEAGVQASYHACDVRDRQALGRLLGAIRASDGPIQGVMHGAGYESALRFEKKKPRDVELTISTKVGGAAALMELTRQDPLRWFIAFGSISGRFGGTGQTDYCVANDMLSKLVDWHRRQRPECRSVCFHWHSWDEVGMAVRPESKHIKDALLVRFMPTREGAEHVIEEILAGMPEPEILITDATHLRRYYPDLLAAGPAADSAAPAPGAASVAAGQGLHAASPLPPAGEGQGVRGRAPASDAALAGQSLTSRAASGWPMIDEVQNLVPQQRVLAEIHLDPTREPFLTQHRLRQRPVMPLVAHLEAMAQAASILAPGKTIVALRDVAAVKVLTFFTDQPVTARVEARAQGGAIACRVTSDFRNRQGQVVVKDQVHARAVLELADAPGAVQLPAPGEPPTWRDAMFLDREAVFYHGPVLRCLKKIYVDEQGGWGIVEAPQPGDFGGQRRPDRWALCPAMLDGCFYACGVHYWRIVQRAIPLPAEIERVRLGRRPRPGERCLLRFAFRGIEKSDGPFVLVGFDFALFGEDLAVILQAEHYRSMILSERTL